MYLATINHPFKYLFGICLCSILTCLLNLQILAQNDNFSILAYFVTIATVKVQSILNKNTWIIHLIKQSKDNVVK